MQKVASGLDLLRVNHFIFWNCGETEPKKHKAFALRIYSSWQAQGSTISVQKDTEKLDHTMTPG